MLVLIDESGCPGFKLAKGSTPYFVVGMVIFTDFKEAERASQSIEDLKKDLGVSSEFKFSKSHPKIKDKFFEVMCGYDFNIRALVLNKSRIYSSHLRESTDAFYNYFVKMLIQYDNDVLLNASVKIDGSGDREFKKVLSTYLRKQIGQQKIKKFRFSDSKRDNLIQLADMVVGAIARSYKLDRKDAARWFSMLKEKGKIKNIWDFK